MSKKIYTLLVGIDRYATGSGVRSLTGCVNDIEAIEEYLRQRIAIENQWKLVETSEVPWKLTNELATRQAVINGFQQHLCQASSDDVVLFYYAGHGSQEAAPEELWDIEPYRKIETLVCYDSRTKQGRDLADKELNYLIEQVAQNNPHILVILDCCHSGTATREPEVIERQIPADGIKKRKLSEFIFPKAWLQHRISENYKLPRHIAIAACRAHQTAKEYIGENGQRRGAFSYFLTQALQRTNSNISYVDLVQDINALITGKVNEQSPQIEAPPEDLRQSFLGGAVGEQASYFTLTYDNKKYHSWVINGGALHGIRQTSEGETLLAVFPQGSSSEQLRQMSQAISQAVVNQVEPEVSKVEVSQNVSLSPEIPYWAVVTDVPLSKLKVCFQGDDEGVKLARQALSKVNGDQPSLLVREVESSEETNYYLEATNGQYWIKQAADKHPLVAPIPEIPDTQVYIQQRAKQIIKRLEHIARWTNILELKTPPTSQIKVGDVEMEVIITSGHQEYSSKQEISEIRGGYTYQYNRWEPPRIEVRVTNNSEQDLYFQIIELAGDYAVDVPEFFRERSSLRLPKQGSEGATLKSQRLKLVIPRAYLNGGITEYQEIFKLIVSTRDFNASLLQQPGLDSPPPIHRSVGLSGTLNRLMNKVYTRQTEREDNYIDNWMTKEIKITLVKPLAGVEIKESDPVAILPGIQLQGHSSLRGKFSLSPLPVISRAINSNLLPPVLLQDLKLTQPFVFNTTRSADPPFSVLEVMDVKNYEKVTPENPLKIVVDKLVAPNEHILPIAYDGEFFLPLGKAKTVNGKTEITLERLPEPIVNSRTLQGSIKILFQKLIY